MIGEIREGTFLSEKDLMRRYGVGRTPFREACNRLHHEQLLEVVPRRGYLVSEVSFRSVRELFETRILLEGLIAELAAARATPEEIDNLEQIAFGNSAEKVEVDDEELVTGNTRFHLCIAHMTRNRELVRLVTGLLERTERLSYLELRILNRTKSTVRSLHNPIIEALRKKDSLAAREAMINDIGQAQSDVLGAKDRIPELTGVAILPAATRV
jgi:DNA-binding GntR family transcriptional regulator